MTLDGWWQGARGDHRVLIRRRQEGQSGRPRCDDGSRDYSEAGQ